MAKKTMKWVAMLGALGVLTFAGNAQGSTTIGQTVNPTGNCNLAPRTFLQTSPSQYVMPFNGVITAWSHQGGTTPPQLKLVIGRAAGGNNFLIVGSSSPQTPAASVPNTFATRISVLAGDVIGFTLLSDGKCSAFADPSYQWRSFNGDATPGATVGFSDPSPGIQFDVSALLEADADNDGFGDETQDQCPTVASTQGACPPPTDPPPTDAAAPDTTIKGGPRKTDSRKVALGFVSSEAGSTFQCRLTGKKVRKESLKQFSPCVSKKKYKRLKPGRYKFFVVATDAAGNVDPTPAKRKFKIVKQR
ncbi:MAG: hypothetical protein ABIZ50_01565 [Solirubrobacterales bacterium]